LAILLVAILLMVIVGYSINGSIGGYSINGFIGGYFINGSIGGYPINDYWWLPY